MPSSWLGDEISSESARSSSGSPEPSFVCPRSPTPAHAHPAARRGEVDHHVRGARPDPPTRGSLSRLASILDPFRVARPSPTLSRRVASSSPADVGTSSVAPRTFDVGVGSTLRVSAAQPWPALYPADVIVETGDAFEAITVEARWTPADGAPRDRPAPTIVARRRDDGDVEVRVRAPAAHPIRREDDDRTQHGRVSVLCRIPPRFCGVDVVSGGGDVHVNAVVEATVRVDALGGDVRLGSVRGAKLRVSTGGGALVASNITADASIRTDGGELDVGKLVGRRLRVRTLGGDARVETLFADGLDLATAGGNARLKTLHVSRYGRVRTSGGSIAARGWRGTGRNEPRWTRGAGTWRSTSAIGSARSSRETRGGDARVAVPEGFAPKLVVHGRVGGEEVRGKEIRRATSTGAASVGHGGSLRVVGGSGDEAARKVAAAAATSVVVVDARVHPPRDEIDEPIDQDDEWSDEWDDAWDDEDAAEDAIDEALDSMEAERSKKAATGRWTTRVGWGFGGGRRRGMARSGAEARHARRRGGRSRATRSWW